MEGGEDGLVMDTLGIDPLGIDRDITQIPDQTEKIETDRKMPGFLNLTDEQQDERISHQSYPQDVATSETGDDASAERHHGQLTHGKHEQDGAQRAFAQVKFVLQIRNTAGPAPENHALYEEEYTHSVHGLSNGHAQCRSVYLCV